MAIERVLYAIRLPMDLKRLIDEAAASGGVSTSQLVIKALWEYLDGVPSAAVVAPVVYEAPRVPDTPPQRMAVPQMNDAMAKFMATVAPVVTYSEPEKPKVQCTNRDQNAAGEWYWSILEKGHRGAHRPGGVAEEYEDAETDR